MSNLRLMIVNLQKVCLRYAFVFNHANLTSMVSLYASPVTTTAARTSSPACSCTSLFLPTCSSHT